MADYAYYLEPTDQRESADRLRREVIELQQELIAEYPDVPALHRSMAITYQNIGASLAERGANEELTKLEKDGLFRESNAAFGKAVGTLDILRSLHPDTPEDRDILAGTYNLWSQAMNGMSRTEAAVECLERARAIWEFRLAADPDDALLRSKYAGVLNNLALFYRKLDRLEEARTLIEEAIDHQIQARDAAPGLTQCLSYLSNHYLVLARICRQQEQAEPAADSFRQAVKLKEQTHEMLDNDFARRDLGGTITEYAVFLSKTDDEAVYDLDESHRLLQRARKIYPESIRVQYHLGRVLTLLEKWKDAVAALQELPQNEFATPFYQTWSAARAASALAHLGETDRAKEMLSVAQLKAEELKDREEIDAYVADVEKLLQGADSSKKSPLERKD